MSELPQGFIRLYGIRCMAPRILVVLLVLINIFYLTASHIFAQATENQTSSDQQINDFSLAGYGEKGKKNWDIAGKSADIFTEVVKLNNVIGNLYGEKEDVRLTADKGDFNKIDGKVSLKDNVTISTSSGARLTTASLEWDRKGQVIKTLDTVNIAKDSMFTTAWGATGRPDLNKVTLEKDVKVDINPPAKNGEPPQGEGRITITCDGPLEIDYQKNSATFKNNVKVDNQQVLIYSDNMVAYFIKSDPDAGVSLGSAAGMGSKIDKIIASGHVKIVRGENISYSDEAAYTVLDKKIVLKGRPRLVIYSMEGMDASFGN